MKTFPKMFTTKLSVTQLIPAPQGSISVLYLSKFALTLFQLTFIFFSYGIW